MLAKALKNAARLANLGIKNKFACSELVLCSGLELAGKVLWETGNK
jgi:hypothetical protein